MYICVDIVLPMLLSGKEMSSCHVEMKSRLPVQPDIARSVSTVAVVAAS